MNSILNDLAKTDTWPDILTLLTAFLGLGFGLWQYYRSQVWNRAKAAYEELRKLEEDEYLSLVCLILDWKARKLLVPVALRPILEKEEIFTHSTGLLMSALSQKGQYENEELIYRDAFDRFFTYLERIDHGIERKIFRKEDLYPLRYWLNQIYCGAHHPPEVFVKFTETFGYSRVSNLHQKLKELRSPSG